MASAPRLAVSRRRAARDGSEFLDDLARRVAVAVAAISVTLDPGLVVLGGEVGQAGRDGAGRPCERGSKPDLPGDSRCGADRRARRPGAAGALLAAVAQARAALLASVADS